MKNALPGTGKFLEVMAQALEMPIEELSVAALESVNPLPITSQCGVFAESEVITHVNEGKDRLDIFAGISLSVAGKVAAVVRRIGLDQPMAIVGGLAKNPIVVRDIGEGTRNFFCCLRPGPPGRSRLWGRPGG